MIPREFLKLILYLIFVMLVGVSCFYCIHKRHALLSGFKSIFSKSSVIDYYNDLKSLNIERWSLILILFIGSFLRLWNLDFWVPIYVDEGIWGLWGEAVFREFALDDFRWLFITYRFAGKPPLVAILFALSYHLFGVNLFAIRAVSAFAGTLSILFVYKLGRTLFGLKVGLLSAFIFSIIPFDIYFSRLALQDPVVSSLIVGSILCYVYGFQKENDLSILLGGVFFGLALDAKQLGLKVILIILLYLLLTKRIRFQLTKTPFWGSLVLSAIVHYPFIYYASLRRFSLYTTYLTEGSAPQTSTSETSLGPISRVINIPTILYDQLSWMFNMFTISVFILVFIGIGILFLRKKAIDLIPVIWILTELFTGWIPHSHHASYILSIVPPASIAAGVGLTLLLEKVNEILIDTRIHRIVPPAIIPISLITLCVSYTAFFTCTLILTPREAKLHPEFTGITDSRWSGYGWKEALEYLQQENFSADTVIFPMPKGGFEFLAKNTYPRIFGIGYLRAYFEGSEFSKELIEDNICVFLLRRYSEGRYEDFDALLEKFPDIKLVKVITIYGIPEVHIFVKY